MKVIKARLLRHRSEDGFITMNPELPLGKEYVIDLDTRKPVTVDNVVTGKSRFAEIVYQINYNDGWLFTEMLEWHGKGNVS